MHVYVYVFIHRSMIARQILQTKILARSVRGENRTDNRVKSG